MDAQTLKLTQRFNFPSNLNKIFTIVLGLALLFGLGTGYYLASSGGSSSVNSVNPLAEAPKTAQQDKSTFRDFAEGTLEKREQTDEDEYIEGTHLLIRDGAVPVALTSSVVDLSLYEGKKVKVFGETQKALKEGWLMDVGLVE